MLRRISLVLGFGFTLASGTRLAMAQLPLQKGDVVGIVGNGLADRMQHDGWMETVLQSRLAGQEITFRNLAVAGDTVSSRPRGTKVPSVEGYLGLIGADAVFLFFGYNESFGGEAKIPSFQQELGSLIDQYRSAKFNGTSAPRLVLFSPIAREDPGDPILDDGKAHNQNLALYAKAIQELAAAKGVAFVDLFAPSLALFEKSAENLTLNGAHLLPVGNLKLAETIAERITGTARQAPVPLEPLRKAVLDKNWHWHNRYRAMDDNNIWGSRSGLRYVAGQTNSEVLLHELTMLDALTANRDRHIWAVAQGRAHTIDDSNVPPPLPVVSNIGGGGKNAGKEGSPEYLGGRESLAKLHIAAGFEANLFADESMFPSLANPVQLQVDAKGRLWAACWSTYPKWEPLKEMTDCLLIFPDENRDGIADKAIEFAKVHNPLAFAFWNGGVIVASQPDILFLKDTDGDDRADVRIVLFQATGSGDTHHSANNFILGPDGGLYWQSGVFLQHNFEHPWGPALTSTASGMYRFDPRRHAISFIAANGPNPHGTSFDRWGYLFATDGTSSRAFQVRPDGRSFRMFPLLKHQSRPAPANAIISSTHFPQDMQQDLLICNVIGYLGLYRYDLHRDGYQDGGKTFRHGEVWGTPTDDFLRSDDRNFRPSDAEFGSDGALYIADWQNAIIGHMQHNMRDPHRDKKHGRIFRMTCKGRPLQDPVAIDGQPVARLLDHLRHPVDGVRARSRVELTEHPPSQVLPAVRAWVKQFDPKNPEHAHPLLEALWVQQQNHAVDPALLEALLNSPEPHARTAAAMARHLMDTTDPVKATQPVAIADQVKKIRITTPPHLKGADAAQYQLGGEVYQREAHCATCHQKNGKGLDPAFPPLVGSSWVLGDEERLIKLTLHGLWGPIEVQGKLYDPAKGVPPMTAFESMLDDKEVAAVLTYIRNNWGNQAAPVQPETVAQVRARNRDRSTFWKPEELLKDHPMK